MQGPERSRSVPFRRREPLDDAKRCGKPETNTFREQSGKCFSAWELSETRKPLSAFTTAAEAAVSVQPRRGKKQNGQYREAHILKAHKPCARPLFCGSGEKSGKPERMVCVNGPERDLKS